MGNSCEKERGREIAEEGKEGGEEGRRERQRGEEEGGSEFFCGILGVEVRVCRVFSLILQNRLEPFRTV